MLQSGEFPFVETHVVYDRTTMNSLLPHIHPDERLIINLVDQLEPGTHLAVQLPPEFLEPEEGTSRPRLPAGYEYSVGFRDLPARQLTGSSAIGFHLQAAALLGMQRGLDVTCLDDANKIVDASFSRARADMMDAYIAREWAVMDGLKPGDHQLPEFELEHADELRQIADDQYRLEVSADHIDRVEIPDLVVARIVEEKPDVAIVDQAVAFLLAPNSPDMLSSDGNTRTAEVGGKLIKLVGIRQVHDSDYAAAPSLNKSPTWQPWEKRAANYQRQRQQIARQRLAIETGRIVSGLQPDFTGTFTPERSRSDAEGLFEVYTAREGVFSGVIEDIYGTAQFEGLIDDSIVSFTKTYAPELFLPTTTHDPNTLNYRGLRQNDGSYAGVWIDKEDPSFNGVFRLKKSEAA